MEISYQTFKELSNQLIASSKAQLNNDFSSTSDIWDSIFSYRDSLKDFSDLLISSNDRFNFINGVAEVIPSNKKELFIAYYKTFLNRDLIEQLPLSWIGSPSVIEFDGLPVSSAYLSNLRLFSELKAFLTDHIQDTTKPLNILEIGAGYGGLGYFLVKSGIAASYTIIDLPKNLELSSFYLTQNFQTLSWQVLSAEHSVNTAQLKTLNFLTPGNIHSISQCQFDLIVNSDSLGEMPALTSKAYIKWIHEHLIDNGHFFSKNGHRRSTQGVQLPSEYGYQLFNLVEIKPSTAVSSLFDDFSHYIFLSKSPNSKENDFCHLNHLDTLCALYAAGLHDELIEISKALSNKNLTTDQIRFLSLCHNFFSTKSLSKKIFLLESQHFDGLYFFCLCYLKGLTQYLKGNNQSAAKWMKEYRTIAKSHIGEAYAILILAQQDRSILNSNFNCKEKTNYVLEEIRTFYSFKQPFRALALTLRKDVLRRKLNYPQNYSPSLLLKIKNILFNLREGKKFNAARGI